MPKQILHTIEFISPVMRHSPHNSGIEPTATFLGTSIDPAGKPRALELEDTLRLDIEFPNIDVTAYEKGREYQKLFFLVQANVGAATPAGLHRLEFKIRRPNAKVGQVVHELLGFIALHQKRPGVKLQPEIKRSTVCIHEVSSLTITIAKLNTK